MREREYKLNKGEAVAVAAGSFKLTTREGGREGGRESEVDP